MMVICSATFYTTEQLPDPGEALAKQYCSSCHSFPDPSILTKKSWNYLLTDMGFRLGIVDYSYLSGANPLALFSMSARQQVLNAGHLIPNQPLLSENEWQAIRDYFESHAPQKPLPQASKTRVQAQLPLFELKIPDFQPPQAVLTLTRINDTSGGLLVYNQKNEMLTEIGVDLKSNNSSKGYNVVVDEQMIGEDLFLLSIGDLIGEHIGTPRGSVIKRGANGNETTVLPNLLRPADMEFADLDGDGEAELIICNFGDVTGDVSIFKKAADQYTLQKTVIQAPGAIKSLAHDFNEDGLQDVAVLMGDARENISLFLNEGNNTYERKIVVETHSAYGHTYFELQDFNSDGHMDLLVTNGDTDADPYNTLKNYHGFRIYMNDGKNNFTEEFFYPMYGAHFAKAYDFDADGDLDIAASAFFPDFFEAQPEQFVYLENQGNLNFRAFTHPETFQGRWMTLDIGDYDLDGDQDIALGAGYLSLGMAIEHKDKLRQMRGEGKALLILENQLK